MILKIFKNHLNNKQFLFIWIYLIFPGFFVAKNGKSINLRGQSKIYSFSLNKLKEQKKLNKLNKLNKSAQLNNNGTSEMYKQYKSITAKITK